MDDTTTARTNHGRALTQAADALLARAHADSEHFTRALDADRAEPGTAHAVRARMAERYAHARLVAASRAHDTAATRAGAAGRARVTPAA